MPLPVCLPHDVYADLLEDYLLTSCLQHLALQEGVTLPRQIGMLARNDVFTHARLLLNADSYDAFVSYSQELSGRIGAKVPAIMPMPLSDPHPQCSTAEILAWNTLDSGGGSLWESVRQTVIALRYEAPRQRMMHEDVEASSFHLGVCARGALVGICKDTLQHKHVCRLLCFFVQHVCPGHRFTSIAVNRNYQTPPHRDLQNGPEENLILSLSLHDAGGLWVETIDGSVYRDIEGKLVRGDNFALHAQALLFLAHRCWHASLPWDDRDRYTMVAYTVRNWPRLRQEACSQLEELGFYLPDRPQTERAEPALLPPVLISPCAP